MRRYICIRVRYIYIYIYIYIIYYVYMYLGNNRTLFLQSLRQFPLKRGKAASAANT
jgi:hypothetical protein